MNITLFSSGMLRGERLRATNVKKRPAYDDMDDRDSFAKWQSYQTVVGWRGVGGMAWTGGSGGMRSVILLNVLS